MQEKKEKGREGRRNDRKKKGLQGDLLLLQSPVTSAPPLSSLSQSSLPNLHWSLLLPWGGTIYQEEPRGEK